MAMIGNPIASTDFPVDYASGNGSTTAFTLSVAPASVNSIAVSISGVSQSPQTYSVSGTTLTFSAAPPTGTNNIVVRHLGIAGIPNVPSAGSVVPSSIGAGYSLWNLSGSDVNYTAGNVGIGNSVASTINTANGTGRLVIGTGTGDSGLTIYTGATSIGGISFANGTTGTNTYRGYLSYNNASDYMSFWTAATERMRIDSSGNLLVGTTASSPGYGNTNTGCRLSNVQSNFSSNTVDWVSTVNQNGSDGGARYLIGFRVSNSQVGNIQSNGSNCTFNSTSDYRLKEDVAPMTGALDRVSALKPVTYKWKLDGSEGEGFIAHELQAVVPECVTGAKDAVDSEGNPVYQGIDTSFLVATLVAAIQELKAELDATKAEVAALKTGA